MSINLLDFDRQGLVQFLAELGEPSFRAKQIFKWMHQVGLKEVTHMHNLNKSLRECLSEMAVIELPQLAYQQTASDGTQKFLLRLACGNCIETVFIPEDDRGTLCVSSQVGCALNCQFCSTAKQGFNRNLSTAEIIAQVWIANRFIAKRDDGRPAVTNVVMMGMGEPLLNFDNVVRAMDIMLDDYAYGLSKRRVTLSTAGVVPAMRQLSQVSPVSLAVSLHAPNDELRNTLVPLNKKYPLAVLLEACRQHFVHQPRRRVTFEYVMLAGVNDQPTHAKQLIKLLQAIPAKVNLIPFNHFPGAGYTCSSDEVITQFRDRLLASGINTIVRRTRGDAIDAACGQLVGKVMDRTKRSKRWQTCTQEAA